MGYAVVRAGQALAARRVHLPAEAPPGSSSPPLRTWTAVISLRVSPPCYSPVPTDSPSCFRIERPEVNLRSSRSP